jgi:hypothetical protein
LSFVVVEVVRGIEEVVEGSGVDVVVGGVSVGGVGVRFCGRWSFVMSSSSKSMIAILPFVVCDGLEESTEEVEEKVMKLTGIDATCDKCGEKTSMDSMSRLVSLGKHLLATSNSTLSL